MFTGTPRNDTRKGTTAHQQTGGSDHDGTYGCNKTPSIETASSITHKGFGLYPMAVRTSRSGDGCGSSSSGGGDGGSSNSSGTGGGINRGGVIMSGGLIDIRDDVDVLVRTIIQAEEEDPAFVQAAYAAQARRSYRDAALNM